MEEHTQQKAKWLLNGHMPSKNYCLIDLEYYLRHGSYLQTTVHTLSSLRAAVGEGVENVVLRCPKFV